MQRLAVEKLKGQPLGINPTNNKKAKTKSKILYNGNMTALLALLPMLLPAQVTRAQDDPLHVSGADAFVEIDAGGDGLRNDSVVYADVIFKNGMRSQTTFTHGIADNGKGRMKLPTPWIGPSSRIAYVNLTLTGKRGGTEGTDDFDIKTVKVVIRPRSGGELVMYRKNNINVRLHGVGSWTSNLIEPMTVTPMFDIENNVYADIYTGEQPLRGGTMELGLAVNGTYVWGQSGRNLRAEPLSHIRVGFLFPAVVHLSQVKEIELRQMGRGFKRFGINGLSIFTNRTAERVPYPIETELIHSLNTNFDMSPGKTWVSSRVTINPPEFTTKGGG